MRFLFPLLLLLLPMTAHANPFSLSAHSVAEFAGHCRDWYAPGARVTWRLPRLIVQGRLLPRSELPTQAGYEFQRSEVVNAGIRVDGKGILFEIVDPGHHVVGPGTAWSVVRAHPRWARCLGAFVIDRVLYMGDADWTNHFFERFDRTKNRIPMRIEDTDYDRIPDRIYVKGLAQGKLLRAKKGHFFFHDTIEDHTVGVAAIREKIFRAFQTKAQFLTAIAESPWLQGLNSVLEPYFRAMSKFFDTTTYDLAYALEIDDRDLLAEAYTKLAGEKFSVRAMARRIKQELFTRGLLDEDTATELDLLAERYDKPALTHEEILSEVEALQRFVGFVETPQRSAALRN